MVPGSSGYGTVVEVAGSVAVIQTYLYMTGGSDLYNMSVIEHQKGCGVCGLFLLVSWGTLLGSMKRVTAVKLTMWKQHLRPVWLNTPIVEYWKQSLHRNGTCLDCFGEHEAL